MRQKKKTISVSLDIDIIDKLDENKYYTRSCCITQYVLEGIRFNSVKTGDMVIINNDIEHQYMNGWLRLNSKPVRIFGADNYPIAIASDGSGWTDSMDRALRYVRFADFVYSQNRSFH